MANLVPSANCGILRNTVTKGIHQTEEDYDDVVEG
jgi:hypothetical protein